MKDYIHQWSQRVMSQLKEIKYMIELDCTLKLFGLIKQELRNNKMIIKKEQKKIKLLKIIKEKLLFKEKKQVKIFLLVQIKIKH